MGFNGGLIRSTVDLLGADHVLVGSDWPIVNEGPIRPHVGRAFAAAKLTEDEQQLIASGNTLRLLGLQAEASSRKPDLTVVA
jgi:aminocarboxymuconate-semialdehyde decarboxylase